MTHRMAAIIEVKNLTKKYKNFTAVNDISFSVENGETFGILGPNGAGKTTTLEMIEGLKVPTSGTIMLDGKNVEKETDAVKSVIGVQLQASTFFEGLNLVEVLNVFAAMYGREINAMELLADVELTDKAKNQVKELSGGQKQRLSIAVGLVNDPKVLFLDEPTTGLDPQARRHLWELVKAVKKKGKTVILTTHYMDEAEVLCDRIAIMDAGKIIELGTPDMLIKDLLAGGFSKPVIQQQANLEDVFLKLTGHALRE
jgi:ABC-2 type transport system ATP-binding protein